MKCSDFGSCDKDIAIHFFRARTGIRANRVYKMCDKCFSSTYIQNWLSINIKRNPNFKFENITEQEYNLERILK